MNLIVPGAVYFFCLDPQASDKPSEAGWPSAVVSRHGKGWRARYDVGSDVASEIVQWVRLCAEGIVGGAPGEDQDARRALRWANSVQVTP